MEQSARQPDPAFELSLVRGDLLFRVQPVVDIAAAYDAVKAMRTLPIGKSAIVPIAAAAAAPMLAVLAIQVPVGELLLKLLKALV